MKLREGFITHESETGQIMVAAGKSHFSGLVRSNHTAAFIINCLKTEVTKEQLVEKIMEKYGVSGETVEKDVELVIEKLRSIGAIDD